MTQYVGQHAQIEQNRSQSERIIKQALNGLPELKSFFETKLTNSNKLINNDKQIFDLIFDYYFSKEFYLEQLQRLPELDALISTPYILFQILNILLTIIEETANESKETKRVQLTRYRVYEHFTQQHFKSESRKIIPTLADEVRRRELPKLKAMLDVKEDWQLFEKYTRDLAFDLFQRRQNDVQYDPTKPPASLSSLKASKESKDNVNTNAPWAQIYFDDAYEVKQPEEKVREDVKAASDDAKQHAFSFAPLTPFLRRGSLLKPLGQHRWTFSHKSLIEFFAAQHLFNGALVSAWVMTHRDLNDCCLLDEPQVIELLADKVNENDEFRKVLFDIIETSKYEPDAWVAAANAITILNAANVSFSGMDLRRIRIGGTDRTGRKWGADLSAAILDNTDLREADLRFVNFTQTWLGRAQLDGSCMDNVIFSELPGIEDIYWNTHMSSLEIPGVVSNTGKYYASIEDNASYWTVFPDFF